MRISGLIGDYLGEPRCEEVQGTYVGAAGLRVSWQGGGTRMGSPFGLPLGDDPGIAFQLYANATLSDWTGGNSLTTFWFPTRHTMFEIFAIAAHLASTSQSNLISTTGGETVTLTWTASTSSDVKEYRIYANDGAGGAVDYDTLYATVTASVGGYTPDTYSYKTARLASGSWTFGIRAVDTAGNVQTTPTREDTVVIARLPEPPQNPSYTYSGTTYKATLSWQAPANWN